MPLETPAAICYPAAVQLRNEWVPMDGSGPISGRRSMPSRIREAPRCRDHAPSMREGIEEEAASLARASSSIA